MSRINLVSVSGGKDSTALLLLAIERGANPQAVFADTGNEHPLTYEYLDYLRQALSMEIRTVKADFTRLMAGKRKFIEEKWPTLLTNGRPGGWVWKGKASAPTPPAQPGARGDVIKAEGGRWKWRSPILPLSTDAAQAKIALALQMLHPTGNPFLDMCLWKGRFPSTKTRFCTEELKVLPITLQVVLPLIKAGEEIWSWQGVRADESLARRDLPEQEYTDPGITVYRPILTWTAKDVFRYADAHGIKPNPLYLQGMGRVGCMPCINCRKDELLEISKRFPEEIARIREWEQLVSEASKRGSSTFFVSRQEGATYETHGIDTFVKWSKTSRGNSNLDMFRSAEEAPMCASNYGLCE